MFSSRYGSWIDFFLSHRPKKSRANITDFHRQSHNLDLLFFVKVVSICHLFSPRFRNWTQDGKLITFVSIKLQQLDCNWNRLHSSFRNRSVTKVLHDHWMWLIVEFCLLKLTNKPITRRMRITQKCEWHTRPLRVTQWESRFYFSSHVTYDSVQ